MTHGRGGLGLSDQPEHIVVTGSEGFVGSHLVRYLRSILSLKHKIIAVTRHGEASGDAALDITDAAAVDALLAHYRPIALIHLAGIAAPLENVALGRLSWETNLFGTINLADSLARHRRGAMFIFSSSAEVYGEAFNQYGGKPIGENAPLAPNNLYAVTKASADLYLHKMALHDLRVVRFRPFNHTGPGQSEKFVVPAFAGQIARIMRGHGPNVIKVGNLDGQRDFLDVRDVIRAYAAPLLQDHWPSGVIVNLASGTPRRIGDILADLIALSGIDVSVEEDPTRLRPNEIPIAFGDTERAKMIFNWSPTIPWETTLRDVLDFALQVEPVDLLPNKGAM